MSIFYFGQKSFEKTSNCLGNIHILLQGVGGQIKTSKNDVGSLWYNMGTEKSARMFFRDFPPKSKKWT